MSASIAILCALVLVLNVAVTWVIVRNVRIRSPLRGLLLVDVWIFPVVGALLGYLGHASAKGKTPISPDSIAGNNPNVPGL
jgi:hypothetical protein